MKKQFHCILTDTFSDEVQCYTCRAFSRLLESFMMYQLLICVTYVICISLGSSIRRALNRNLTIVDFFSVPYWASIIRSLWRHGKCVLNRDINAFKVMEDRRTSQERLAWMSTFFTKTEQTNNTQPYVFDRYNISLSLMWRSMWKKAKTMLIRRRVGPCHEPSKALPFVMTFPPTWFG